MTTAGDHPKRRLRIACYGYAGKAFGSIASANFLMLQELLNRGHEIDFFNKHTFCKPAEFLDLPNFKYIDCYNGFGERVWKISKQFKLPMIEHLGGTVLTRTFLAKVLSQMRRQHVLRKYDLQLFMGTAGFGRLNGVPVVSWTQGPPMTDGRSISRHRAQILRLCGKLKYLQFRAYAIWRSTFGLPRFSESDYFIVGSQWSRTALQRYGVAADKTFAIPYPIDLELFKPPVIKPVGDETSILWLGRIVPRKRLDLFLDACALLIEKGHRLKLTIIGGFAFVPHYKRLIDEFKFPDRLTYKPSISRDQVGQLMNETDLVLQPSEEEDFASTPAEALACGVPVVLGKTNGTVDYVGEAAEIFDEYTPASVANAVEKLISRLRADPGHIATSARATAEGAFELPKVVDQLESLLIRIASSKVAVSK